MITFDMLLAGAWKSAAVLGAAFLAAWMLRRSSAALRHFVWTASFAVLLLLPFLHAARPVAIAAPAIAISALTFPAAAARASIPWAFYLWITGAALVLARFLLGAARAAWLSRKARPAGHAQEILAGMRPGTRIRVLESDVFPVPLAWGVLRPVILLPAGSCQWPDDRLIAVLRHELAHIARGDLAAQYLAQAACCLYWFQPLVWLAVRRQQRDRELACDDAVLAAGIAADQYASHLVEVTRSIAARRLRGLNAATMAAGPDLETRVRALFAPRDRRPLRMRVAFALAAIVLAVGLPVATLHLYAQTARGSVSGVVVDPSGARVPNCLVTAQNLDGANQETAQCNEAGEYRFAAIPPGRYQLTVKKPGFKAMTLPIMVTSNLSATVNATLNMGDVTESITVTGQRPSSAFAQSAVPQKVRVGGLVAPVKLIEAPKPQYPPSLQQAGVEGVVVIRAVISKDGTVLNPMIVNTVAEPAFSEAALAAVSHWRYKPAELNGEPMEAATTITVDFKLGQ